METISNAMDAIKNATNPFVRLVNATTADDGTAQIASYSQEQVLDASHQSDHACEWVHKALCARLEQTSPQVQYKALLLIRLLLLEGPAAFSSRMGSALYRIHQLAHQEYQDAFKNSIEASVRALAGAVNRCCTGEGAAALNNWQRETESGGGGAGGASTQGKFKSAYHQEQVKELAKWRKKQQEEQRAAGGVVIQDKNLLSFRSDLTAQKLIEAVLSAEKKKFAAEEVFSFVDAAVGNAKPVDVCALMDKVIADPRYNIAQRHKMMQMVEGLVMTQGTNEGTGMPSEVGYWWRAHTSNLQKVAVLDAPENQAKAAQMQACAKRIMEHLAVLETVGNIGGGGGASAGGSATAAVAAVAGGNTFGFAAPPPAPVAPPVAAPVVAQPMQQQQQQQQQRSRGASVATAPSVATWQPAFGMTNINPAFAVDSGKAANAAGADMFGGMSVTRKAPAAGAGGGASSTAAAVADIFAPAPSAPPAPAPAPAPPAPGADADMMRQLQEQLQRNMEMMAKLTAAQNAAPAPAPAPQQQQQASASASVWGSSVTAPPPIVEFHADPAPRPAPEPPAAPIVAWQTAVSASADSNPGSFRLASPECNSKEQSQTALAVSANGSFAGAGAVSESSITVPNNSIADGTTTAQLMAQLAAMHQQQLANAAHASNAVAAAAAAPPVQHASHSTSSSRGLSPTSEATMQSSVTAPPPSISSSFASPLPAPAPAFGGAPSAAPAPAPRNHDDQLLITVLQQQLKAAQDQISAQNQMISMMQQQIQMLMLQMQHQAPAAAPAVAAAPRASASRSPAAQRAQSKPQPPPQPADREEDEEDAPNAEHDDRSLTDEGADL